MKFEVGKKYKHDSVKDSYECVYVSSSDAVMRRKDGSHTVLLDDDRTHSFWHEVREPREIWVNIYKDLQFLLVAHPNLNKAEQGRGGMAADKVETIKFREVIE
jgi:hypothetical protein